MTLEEILHALIDGGNYDRDELHAAVDALSRVEPVQRGYAEPGSVTPTQTNWPKAE